MTQHIAILGASNFAREAYWHIKGTDPGIGLVFVEDISDIKTIVMGDTAVPVIKNWKFNRITVGEETLTIDKFVIGVGEPDKKKILVSKAVSNGLEPAATFVHPRALIQGQDCTIGLGGIITPGCIITTNVTIGNYVILNLNTTVGHDTVISDYVTINPGANISGNVTLGEGVLLGTGTVVRDNITIVRGVTTGAQACVVEDLKEPDVVVVGVPAKRLGKR
jgi:sugar O-acyltransferase (sialic acid O-acetyltransferase NeuD family)